MATAVNPRELFGGKATDPVTLSKAFDAYKEALDNAPAAPVDGVEFSEGGMKVSGRLAETEQLLDELVTKGANPSVIESVREEVNRLKTVMPSVAKDLTLTSPLNTGLVLFDLEAPAKMLFPRQTPLRNRIPRKKGVGSARRFKRITGISGSGTGVAPVRFGFTTGSTTESFGPMTLARGAKIAYQADEATVTYKQFSVSDSVSWDAQFAGTGYQDIRQLSQTAVLYAHMLSEERMILGGRINALSTPSAGNFTQAVRNAGTGEVGNSANIANLYVRLTYETIFGETDSVEMSAQTGLSAATGKVVDVTVNSLPPGALGFKVYVGTSTGAANCFYVGRSTNKVTIQFTGGGTGGCPNSGAPAPTTNTTNSASDYDGLFTQTAADAADHVTWQSSVWSSSAPGSEFQELFAKMWESVKADPDTVFMPGLDRKNLSEALKNGASNPSAYRLTISQDQVSGAEVGAVASAIYNEVTGKALEIEVHPWIPQGNCLVVSWALPIPDSEVSDTLAVVGPVDYQAVQWPQVQFTYDVSTYAYQALVNYAPKWHGIVKVGTHA